jgi:predicted tellurium resistance membrane protein TerC
MVVAWRTGDQTQGDENVESLKELVQDPQAWISLLTLSAMEIVLGIDNVVFLAILVGRIPDLKLREKVRKAGLGLALALRLVLLFSLSWLMKLTAPWFTVLGEEISGRDLILLTGGLFLIGKAAHEMYAKLEGPEADDSGGDAKFAGIPMLLVQIALIDMVFSLDSVITAVGMVQQVPIMVAAMIIAVAAMLIFAGPVGDFVQRHPSVKLLALSFLLLIGVMLMAEGMGRHIPKGYIYFAMAFALGVELLNMRFRKVKQRPVQLHGPHARRG